MAATAIASVPSFAPVGPSLIARNQVVVTRNLSFPTRPASYPSWSNEEKPLRLFTHEECRASAPFRHVPTPSHTPAVNPPPPVGQNYGNTAQNGHQHAVLGPSWCIAVFKKLRNFGHRMFSQLTSQT